MTNVLITGACGFVGSTLALELAGSGDGLTVIGLDNLARSGSEANRAILRHRGVRVLHGDIRNPSDLESMPAVDWVIDAAANPSVLAGVAGGTTSRQVMEHNLVGTLNVLEFCRRHRSGLLMLSTSRVYSLRKLAELPMETVSGAFAPKFSAISAPGFCPAGVTEAFSTEVPLSLYGASKLASEIIALEYAAAFNLRVHINRCGVLAGAGQFGKADQGIFSYWIHSYCRRRPLRYIGFGGTGHQVRDCLHPRDLTSLLRAQMRSSNLGGVLNVGGGLASSMSLAQLSDWCANRFGNHPIQGDPEPRPFDIPWLVLDNAEVERVWGWKPATPLQSILEEIAGHAEQHPDWLECSADA